MQKRKELKLSEIKKAHDVLVNEVLRRLDKKGYDSFIGTHEAYGILAEEFYELCKAMHENDTPEFKEELMDIAAGCIIAYASL